MRGRCAQRGGTTMASADRPELETSPAAGTSPHGAAAALAESSHNAGPAAVQSAAQRRPPRFRRIALLLGAIIGVAAAVYYVAPAIRLALDTVSTDDAYINGHVTFVAP